MGKGVEVRVRGGVKVRCGEGVEVREGRVKVRKSVRTELTPAGSGMYTLPPSTPSLS